MRRIESIHVTHETRRMLRERLTRFLPTYSVSTDNLHGAVRPLVSDIDVLDIFLNLEFSCGKDILRARRLYDQASQAQIASSATPSLQLGVVETSNDSMSMLSTGESASAPHAILPTLDNHPEGDGASTTEGISASENDTDGAITPLRVTTQIIAASPSLDGLSPPPSFDELVERGWIRISWDRYEVPQDIWMAVSRNPQSTGFAFRKLIEERYKDVFALKSGFSPSGALREIADGIVSGQHRPDEIPCVSRDWIAARLWDASSDGSDVDAEQRISQWVDRWELLNFPQFPLSKHLERASFKEFIEAAIGLLRAPSTTPGWEEFRNAAGGPTALLYPHRGAAAGSIIPAIPATAVDRIRWIAHGGPEQMFYEYLETKGSRLLTVLINELAGAMFDPLELAARLMEIAVERPVVLQQLAMRAQRTTPALLADMLMSPSTCTVACSLIASWEFNSGGWNREFQEHSNHTTELLAFEDALAILGGHLDTGDVHSNELAALYLYVYELASAPHQPTHRHTMLSLLRDEVTAAETSVQDSVVAALIASARSSTDPTTAFCAALDLASDGGCADRIAPSEMVALYLDVVMPLGNSLAPGILESKGAQLLVTLALRCDEILRSRFLNAIDVFAWLQHAPASEDEQYMYLDQLKRRIRLHIRVMCRAIAGWPTEIPEDLVESLARAVRTGVIDQPERGRIDAFALGFNVISPWAPDDRPIALDLAAAIRSVQGDAVQRLVTVFCQIEEPAVLAGIVANTPSDLNRQIRTHLQTLTPENSPKVWSLHAFQARIESLLNAKLVDVADIFIAAERGAQTLGNVPGREIVALRERLRVLILREDWPAIAAYSLPGKMTGPASQEAIDTLHFYQALAELKNPCGDTEAAEDIFLALTRRNPRLISYRVNLFAARVSRLLHGDNFQLISGEALRQARRYLGEAQRETRPLIQHSTLDLKVLDFNRAILYLAVNQPRESLQVLLELRETSFEANTEGFRALALARLGSKREALAALVQAERIFGHSDFLSAIRENIDAHRPYATAPNLSLSDDPVPGIRQAFEAFSRLGHVEQAEVLQSQGQLDLYLLEEVRGACASLVAVAPMMRQLGVACEDDISGILKQILRSRLLLPKWAVEDQSRGGFSRSGGVGERDIVVSNGAETLAVLEALIVDTVETVNLTSHFNKLLGYDTCRFFFHITYVRRDDSAGILDHLKSACTEPPSGFNYIRLENLADFGSMPAGFKAYYESNSRSIIVVFLALELGQPIQRAAATLMQQRPKKKISEPRAS